MLRSLVLSVLVLLSVIVLTAQPNKQNIVGTWQLLSRVDRDSAGNLLEEPGLGKDPIGYLVYDAAGNVFAQLMARHRSPNSFAIASPAATNNPISDTTKLIRLAELLLIN